MADEQARFGFTEKALEALRRASEVEPGRPDVGRRIASLKKAAAAPPAAGPAAERPDWGAALDDAFPETPAGATNGNEAGAESGGPVPEAAAPAPLAHGTPAAPTAASPARAAGGPSSEDTYLPESELEPEPPLAGADRVRRRSPSYT